MKLNFKKPQIYFCESKLSKYGISRYMTPISKTFSKGIPERQRNSLMHLSIQFSPHPWIVPNKYEVLKKYTRC